MHKLFINSNDTKMHKLFVAKLCDLSTSSNILYILLLEKKKLQRQSITGCHCITGSSGNSELFRNMAARARLPLLCPKNLPQFRNQSHVHSEAAVKEPNYPPIVPSLTAKSKSARRRQVEEHVKKICASPVDEKLSLVTRVQRMKFVVYPQTFARNADKWYQHFTKTAYIPGLPETFASVAQDPTSEDGSAPPAARTIVPGLPDNAFEDIRSLVTRVILHEHWHLKKKRVFLYRRQEHMVAPLLRNLVSGLTCSLAKYNPLLLQSSLGIGDSFLSSL